MPCQQAHPGTDHLSRLHGLHYCLDLKLAKSFSYGAEEELTTGRNSAELYKSLAGLSWRRAKGLSSVNAAAIAARQNSPASDSHNSADFSPGRQFLLSLGLV
jgi:hypothetical protein